MTRLLSRSRGLYRQLRLLRNVSIAALKGLRSIHPTAFVHLSCDVAADLEVGPYVFLGRRCTIAPMVRIGPYTMLASEVAIVGDDHIWSDPTRPMQFAGRPVQRPTTIGADVWLGQRVVVLRGVTVGDGAVVAAGAVVTRDIPAREVWAGVPARKLRDRFPSQDDAYRHGQMLGEPKQSPTFADPPESYERSDG
jgi:acetyltransferase-like isoleucine patch superfamily enzyme